MRGGDLFRKGLAGICACVRPAEVVHGCSSPLRESCEYLLVLSQCSLSVGLVLPAHVTCRQRMSGGVGGCRSLRGGEAVPGMNLFDLRQPAGLRRSGCSHGGMQWSAREHKRMCQSCVCSEPFSPGMRGNERVVLSFCTPGFVANIVFDFALVVVVVAQCIVYL